MDGKGWGNGRDVSFLDEEASGVDDESPGAWISSLGVKESDGVESVEGDLHGLEGWRRRSGRQRGGFGRRSDGGSEGRFGCCRVPESREGRGETRRSGEHVPHEWIRRDRSIWSRSWRPSWSPKRFLDSMSTTRDSQYGRLVERNPSRFDPLLLRERLDFLLRQRFHIDLDLRSVDHHDVLLLRHRRSLPHNHQHLLLAQQHRVVLDSDPRSSSSSRKTMSLEARNRLRRRINHDIQRRSPRVGIASKFTLDVGDGSVV